MSYFESLFDSMLSLVPSVLHALILLVLAFFVASLAQKIVVKALKKFEVQKHTDKVGIFDEDTGSSLDYIGKLVYFIVFLLFLPEVFKQLGLHDVAQPITQMATQFINYIPNIIGALIIIVVGTFLAKIVRQLLIPFFKKLNVDKLQEKAGINTSNENKISMVLADIVYVLIFIPVIIAALQVLNIAAISIPAISMLDRIILFFPNIFVAIALIIIGIYIARIVCNLLGQVLASIGTDCIGEKIFGTENEKLQKVSLSKIISEIVKYVIVLLFVVESINVLKLDVLQNVGQGIISYIPSALSAVIIMGIAILLANWVDTLISKNSPDSKFAIVVAKTSIIVIASFMALSQLGIAKPIVNAAFIIILGALAVAFAVAFGVGGRNFASNVLKNLEEKHSFFKDEK